jgi:acyl carrier protein
MASQPIPARDTLEQQLVTLISERLLETRPGFGADSDLYENGLDSMAIMQLLVLVEEEYGVSIPESALTRKNFCSVRQLASLLGERAEQAA